MFAIAPEHAQILFQGDVVASGWRSMRVHHNRLILAEEARHMTLACNRLAMVRVSCTFQATPSDEPSEENLFEALLAQCRKTMVGLARMERLLISDVARYQPLLAPALIRAVDAAQATLRELRAFFAIALGEDDDVELGVEFVPAAPREVPNTGSVDFDFEPIANAPDADRNNLRFTEAAAAQLSIMKARADAHPDSQRSVLWEGVCVILRDLRSSKLFEPKNTEHDQSRSLPVMKLGKVRIYFVCSPESRRVTVLLLDGEREEWQSLESVRSRLEGLEWNGVFQELDAFIRPSVRGLRAMRAVLAAREALTVPEEALRHRLAIAEANDPVYVEDIRATVDAVACDAEDAIDAEDLQNSDTGAGPAARWSDVRSDLR